ncbi:general stress protein [Anaerospora hongkongensis]|nr:general stress protein [Anaerospora hongkongensis]
MQQNNETNQANAVITSYSGTQQSGSATASTTNASQGANQSGGGVKAVIGVFSDRDSAEKAVRQLRSQGFNTEEINIISKGQNNSGSKTYEDDITDGALTGGTLGGIGGLLVGAGALAIPGIGPIIAAGPIAAALSGAVAGSIAGGLIDWGIPAETSQKYEQSVAQGNILAVIRSDAAKVQQAAQILRQNGASDVESHTSK